MINFDSKAVKRYEPTMRLVCANYPSPVILDPSPLSIETFSCRFRDAVKATHFHNVKTSIPLSDLAIWWDDFQVAKIGERIVIASPLEIKKYRQSLLGKVDYGKPVSAAVTLAGTELQVNSKPILEAILLLLKEGVLQDATIQGMTEDQVNLALEGTEFSAVQGPKGVTIF